MFKRQSKFVTFEELPVFRQTHNLTLTIYKITASFPKSEIYGLTSQIRRSASSVAANIVEGLHRSSKKELIQFLYQAKASCAETIYHLILAKDLKYIKTVSYGELRKTADEIIKQLNGWIRSEKKRVKLLNIKH